MWPKRILKRSECHWRWSYKKARQTYLESVKIADERVLMCDNLINSQLQVESLEDCHSSQLQERYSKEVFTLVWELNFFIGRESTLIVLGHQITDKILTVHMEVRILRGKITQILFIYFLHILSTCSSEYLNQQFSSSPATFGCNGIPGLPFTFLHFIQINSSKMKNKNVVKLVILCVLWNASDETQWQVGRLKLKKTQIQF